ncbi:hypothetical protein AFL42_10225 [Oceanobacillus caeni]|uniref:Transposase n=1 Tax=Oceanobacillus caeni TaxID=405946 RepID=A0ABR5MII1_9BACI|nr:hypothetical protein AFL42_10225 [Oceanobacillus caeni]
MLFQPSTKRLTLKVYNDFLRSSLSKRKNSRMAVICLIRKKWGDVANNLLIAIFIDLYLFEKLLE